MKIDWPNITLSIGNLGRVRCEPGWHLGKAHSEHLRDFDLWFVWTGQGRMHLRDQVIDLYPGVCIWMRPGGIYLGSQNPDNRLGVTYIHFTLESGGRILTECPLPEVHYIQDIPFFDTVTRRIIRLIHGVRLEESSARRLEAEALLRGVLIGLEETANHDISAFTPVRAEHRRRIQEITLELLENSGDAPSVAELARRTGYSSAHFSRVFREVTGVMPREYIIQVRLERAKQLLRESSMTIGEIADSLRYGDVFFFSRQFKERTGMSPTEFRQAC